MLLISTAIITLLLWLSNFVFLEIAKSKVSRFVRKFPLENYYGDSTCILDLKENFTYEIKTGDSLVRSGDWIYYGKSPGILVDGEILGLDENLRIAH